MDEILDEINHIFANFRHERTHLATIGRHEYESCDFERASSAQLLWNTHMTYLSCMILYAMHKARSHHASLTAYPNIKFSQQERRKERDLINVLARRTRARAQKMRIHLAHHVRPSRHRRKTSSSAVTLLRRRRPVCVCALVLNYSVDI